MNRKADDTEVPMQVFQAQRIKVLEAQLKHQTRLAENATMAAAKANAALAAMQSLGTTSRTERRGRRPTYTKDLLLQVWMAHQNGEDIASIAKRFGADLTMMKTFVDGDYWTLAAREAYAEIGVPAGSVKRSIIAR